MIPNERIIGLDPGGTTGWAKYDALYLPDPDNDGKPMLVEEDFSVGQFGPHEHHDDLYQQLEMWHIHNYTIVTESFEFRQYKQRDNINLMSREYIGIAKLVAQQRKCKFAKYAAGLSKGLLPDKGPDANKKLKAMGWYTPSMKHSNDAARVLAYHMISQLGRSDLTKSWRSLA